MRLRCAPCSQSINTAHVTNVRRATNPNDPAVPVARTSIGLVENKLLAAKVSRWMGRSAGFGAVGLLGEQVGSGCMEVGCRDVLAVAMLYMVLVVAKGCEGRQLPFTAALEGCFHTLRRKASCATCAGLPLACRPHG
jgi:hypothetical protein